MSKSKRINVGSKGKTGELDWGKMVTKYTGQPARRGQQYSGSPDSPDVVTPTLPFHWEVKRTERLSIFKAMEQCVGDCGEGKVPVVAHRQNRKEWLCILRASDFLKLIKPQ